MNTAAESASEPADLWVESLDLDAQGVARRANGKVVFIEGALPFERVTVQVHRHKNQWEQGTLAELLQPSSQRVSRHVLTLVCMRGRVVAARCSI